MRVCVQCGHQTVPQGQLAGARSAGRDVRGYAGRGLCRVCYNAARVPRPYKRRTKNDKPRLLEDQHGAHDAAITCAEHVPDIDALRDVLDKLGLLDLPRRRAMSA